MDGAPVSSIRIAANKAWTAARDRKSTQDIGDRVRHPENGHDIAYYGDPKFVGWAGGIPVWRDGEVVGAVAVSGLSFEPARCSGHPRRRARSQAKKRSIANLKP